MQLNFELQRRNDAAFAAMQHPGQLRDKLNSNIERILVMLIKNFSSFNKLASSKKISVILFFSCATVGCKIRKICLRLFTIPSVQIIYLDNSLKIGDI